MHLQCCFRTEEIVEELRFIEAELPLESPFFPGFLQEIATSTSGNPVDLVVRAHETTRVAFLDAALEWRLERVRHVLLCYLITNEQGRT